MAILRHWDIKWKCIVTIHCLRERNTAFDYPWNYESILILEPLL